MRVKELIKRLQQMPQDKETKIIGNAYSLDNQEHAPIKEIKYSENLDKVIIAGWEGV
jgi:hypothetical protein